MDRIELFKRASILHKQRVEQKNVESKKRRDAFIKQLEQEDAQYALWYSLSLICIEEHINPPIHKLFSYHCPQCNHKLTKDEIHIHRSLWGWSSIDPTADAKYYKCTNCTYEFAEAEHNSTYESDYLTI